MPFQVPRQHLEEGVGPEPICRRVCLKLNFSTKWRILSRISVNSIMAFCELTPEGCVDSKQDRCEFSKRCQQTRPAVVLLPQLQRVLASNLHQAASGQCRCCEAQGFRLLAGFPQTFSYNFCYGPCCFDMESLISVWNEGIKILPVRVTQFDLAEFSLF